MIENDSPFSNYVEFGQEFLYVEIRLVKVINPLHRINNFNRYFSIIELLWKAFDKLNKLVIKSVFWTKAILISFELDWDIWNNAKSVD